MNLTGTGSGKAGGARTATHNAHHWFGAGENVPPQECPRCQYGSGLWNLWAKYGYHLRIRPDLHPDIVSLPNPYLLHWLGDKIHCDECLKVVKRGGIEYGTYTRLYERHGIPLRQCDCVKRLWQEAKALHPIAYDISGLRVSYTVLAGTMSAEQIKFETDALVYQKKVDAAVERMYAFIESLPRWDGTKKPFAVDRMIIYAGAINKPGRIKMTLTPWTGDYPRVVRPGIPTIVRHSRFWLSADEQVEYGGALEFGVDFAYAIKALKKTKVLKKVHLTASVLDFALYPVNVRQDEHPGKSGIGLMSVLASTSEPKTPTDEGSSGGMNFRSLFAYRKLKPKTEVAA